MYKTHVQNDWQLFYSIKGGKTRVAALCGSNASPSTVGVPGITEVTRGRWCKACLTALEADLTAWFNNDHVDLPQGLIYFYRVARAETARCLGSDIKDKELEPLWSKSNQSFNNRYYVIWATMMDRCYDPSNPHFSGWGQNGLTVDEYWHSFDTFVLDCPDGAKGVFPAKGSKVISRKSCVWV